MHFPEKRERFSERKMLKNKQNEHFWRFNIVWRHLEGSMTPIIVISRNAADADEIKNSKALQIAEQRFYEEHAVGWSKDKFWLLLFRLTGTAHLTGFFGFLVRTVRRRTNQARCRSLRSSSSASNAS